MYTQTKCHFPPKDSNDIDEILLSCDVFPVVVELVVIAVFISVATDVADVVLLVLSSVSNSKSIISCSDVL